MSSYYHAPPKSWRGDPVPIIVPSNPDPKRNPDPAPTSTRTTNPYNPSILYGPRRLSRQIGNTTSRSTLVHSAASAPPTKKRRLDNGAAPHSKGKNKDFPITVSDYEEVSLGKTNIPSGTGTSKYEFSSDARLKSSSRQFSILDDGDTYKEIASKQSSDPIDEFPPDRSQGGSQVSRLIRQFDNRDNPRGPKVDLLQETRKRSMRGKSKPTGLMVKPLFTTQPRNAQPEAHKIPVYSFYFNAQLWQSMPQQQHWMYTRNKRLFLEDDSGKQVNESLGDNAYAVTLREPSELRLSSVPTIQFESASPTKETITVWLDINHPQWNMGTYVNFVDTLKNYGVERHILRSDTGPLWSMAKQDATLRGNEKKHEISAGLEELKGHIISDPSLSRHTTTTTTTLKRKANLRSPDTQAGLSSYQPESEAGSFRPTGNALPMQRNLRNRKKVAVDAQADSSSCANPDEVVLSYPAGLPGAVNITNSDLERLNPGAFLNDSLIEFGLKVWLRDLEDSNPELVDQIHVFNSFFYKKFNTKKDLQVAYDSVRKWTNKFDIFRKKYIIVPINEHLHWYLAIIYEPEHVIKDFPVERKSLQRPQTRQTTAHAHTKQNSNPNRIGQHQNSSEMQLEDIDLRSEVEVERDLEDFQNSCSLEDRPPRPTSPQSDRHSDIYESLTPTDAIMDSPNHRISPAVSEHDFSDIVPPTSPKGKRSHRAVDAASFYQPASSGRQYGKQKKVQSNVKLQGVDVDPNERDEVEIVENVPKSYIFTFDSLGSRHPQAVKKLSAYLRMEAKYKKGIDAAGIIEGKPALLPIQTNFCDCGIYLLHFVQTFMSDPSKYASIILSAKPKSMKDAERKATWLVHKDFEPEGRQQLRLRIEVLSKNWKKLRGNTQKQLEEVTKKDAESEGEVELVESDPGGPPKFRRKTQPQGQKPVSGSLVEMKQ